MNIKFREMKITDYENLIDFWKTIKELHIDDSDTFENMQTYLNRNPGLSHIALDGEKIVGTIKGAQDGRRGYLSHIASSPHHRNLGIAQKLVSIAIDELKKQKIFKVKLYVLDENPKALTYWKHLGWEEEIYDYRTFNLNLNQSKKE